VLNRFELCCFVMCFVVVLNYFDELFCVVLVLFWFWFGLVVLTFL
jgi:hypothetical protein